jgi:hypothetical protein
MVSWIQEKTIFDIPPDTTPDDETFMARGVHMMERYKFERRDTSSESSDDHHQDLPAYTNSPIMKRLRLIDFDFLQELYDKAPPSDYKQNLCKVIDTSIEGHSANEPSSKPHQGKNLQTTSELEGFNLGGTIGDAKRNFQITTEPKLSAPYPTTSGKTKKI